jgi:hypothetical protein
VYFPFSEGSAHLHKKSVFFCHSCERCHIYKKPNRLDLECKHTKRQTSREAGTQSQRVSKKRRPGHRKAKPSGPFKNPTAQSAYRGKGFVQKEEEKTIDYSISEENNIPNAQPLEPLVPQTDETTSTQVDDNLVVEAVHTEIEPIVIEEVVLEEAIVEEGIVEEVIVEEAIVEEVIVEEVIVEEAIVEEGIVEEGIVEEVVVEEAIVEEVIVEEVIVEEVIVEEAIVEEVIVEEVIV